VAAAGAVGPVNVVPELREVLVGDKRGLAAVDARCLVEAA
jgi:hypothetical protein